MMRYLTFICFMFFLISNSLSCSVINKDHRSDENKAIKARVVSDSGGVVVSKLKAGSSETQVISASDDSSIKGTSVVFPPGTLSLDAEITVQVGSSIANASTIDSIGLGDDAETTAEGPSVYVLPSEEIDPVVPFQLSIPVPSYYYLLSDNLVVFYQIIKYAKNGEISLGVIPTSQLSKNGDYVMFNASFFGIYQPARITIAVEQTKEVTSETPIAITTELEGTWSSGCTDKSHSSDSSDSSEIRSQNQSFIGAGKAFTFMMEEFDGADCKTPSIKGFFKGTASIGNKSSVIEGAKEIDITFNEVGIKPMNDDATAHFNAEKRCGFSDWKKGESKNILRLNCDDNDMGFVKNGTMYSIFKISNNKTSLQFGKGDANHDGLTPETRENGLDGAILAKK